MTHISLATALASGDLEPFIAQAEADGIGPADRAQFDGLLGRVIKAPQPVDQTSRLRGSGCSREK